MLRTATGPGPQPAHWSRWLAAGVLCGLVLGFAVGLAKPHTRR